MPMKSIKQNKVKIRSVFLLLTIIVSGVIFLDPMYGMYDKKINFEYTENTTLEELAKQLSIPPSKLKEHLELPAETNIHATLAQLGVDQEMVSQAQTEFRKKIWGFSWNIVLVGMLVIFSSLSLTGLFIGLLGKVVRYSENTRQRKQILRGKKARSKTVKASMGDIKSRDAGYNAVIAAITALHFHLQEAEELSQMTLSWKREPVSVWRTSGKFDLPNRVLGDRKKHG